MRIGTRDDHDDRHVAGAAQLPATFEAIDVGKHEIDEHHVGAVRTENAQAVFGARGLGDLVALILQGEPHRGSDAVVVLNEQDARHAPNMP